jgi:hypothetical protein
MNHVQLDTSNPQVYGSQTTVDLCTTFCNRAVLTWHYLRDGQRSRIELGEETITDINLLEIQIRHPNQVRTAKFNRIIEGRVTGADWEWWLGSRSGWLGLRVQAKKLNSHSLQYDSLDHSTTNGRQVDLLIRDANRNRLVPMYCFYNYWDTSRIQSQWRCGTFAPSIELQGCTISSASTVKGLIDANDKSLQSVLKNALPWNCLICCRGHSHPKADLVERASGVLRGTWGLNEEQIRILKEPPSYVSAVLYNEFSNIVERDVSHIMVVTEDILPMK